MRELQRKLDHDAKLQQFFGIKGQRRTNADLEIREANKKIQIQEQLEQQITNYQNILDNIKVCCWHIHSLLLQNVSCWNVRHLMLSTSSWINANFTWCLEKIVFFFSLDAVRWIGNSESYVVFLETGRRKFCIVQLRQWIELRSWNVEWVSTIDSGWHW